MAFLPLASIRATAQDAGMPNVQILLYDGFDELDAVAPFEVLAAGGFTVTTVAAGGPGTVTAHFGLRVGVDAGLGEAPELLIVPGGSWLSRKPIGARAAAADARLTAWIASCHAAGTIVASVCTGAFVLDAAGLLAGRPAVTHHAAIEALQGTEAEVHADARVIDDGDVLSCGGVSSGIDLSLHLIERYFGAAAATAGAARIEHERHGPVLITERGRAAAVGGGAQA
jgi:transcriptional regulator GlxA family with amidase domain